MTRLNCPKCGRETEELPAKEKAPFMYNTVMSEMASVFCRNCGYDLTLMVRKIWK